MKNILVPTDFSPEAHHAFEVALQLAKRVGGNVTLLHVLDVPTDTQSANFSSYGGPVNGAELPNSQGMDGLFTMKLLEVTKQKMQALISEAAQLTPGVPVQDSAEVLRVDNAILKEIEERNIDLVVLGTQHHSALEDFFTITNTEAMVRKAPCPVLAVKQKPTQLDVRDIVFPSDFSAEAEHAAAGLKAVQAIFPDANLHLLHITDNDPTGAERQMLEFAQRHQLQHAMPAVYDADSTSGGIEEFAQQVRAGLIVMPTHVRSNFSHLFSGSVAEDVATHAAAPVLTFHL